MKMYSVLLFTFFLVVSLTTGFPVEDSEDDGGVDPSFLKPAPIDDASRPASIDEPSSGEEPQPEQQGESTYSEADEEEIVPVLYPDSEQQEQEDEQVQETDYSNNYYQEEEQQVEGTYVENEETYEEIRKKRSSGDQATPVLTPGNSQQEAPVEATTESDTITIDACEPLRKACEATPNGASCSAFRAKCLPDQEGEGVFKDPFDWVAGADKK